MRNLLIGIVLGALVVSAVAAVPTLQTGVDSRGGGMLATNPPIFHAVSYPIVTQAIVPAMVGADEPNTNAEAVKFSNEKVRVAANKLVNAYAFAKLVSAEWTGNNMGELFRVGSVLVDGWETDGRHPVTGNDVTLIIVRLNELVADYEADNNAKLNTLLNVATNYEGQD